MDSGIARSQQREKRVGRQTLFSVFFFFCSSFQLDHEHKRFDFPLRHCTLTDTTGRLHGYDFLVSETEHVYFLHRVMLRDFYM